MYNTLLTFRPDMSSSYCRILTFKLFSARHFSFLNLCSSSLLRSITSVNCLSSPSTWSCKCRTLWKCISVGDVTTLPTTALQNTLVLHCTIHMCYKPEFMICGGFDNSIVHLILNRFQFYFIMRIQVLQFHL